MVRTIIIVSLIAIAYATPTAGESTNVNRQFVVHTGGGVLGMAGGVLGNAPDSAPLGSGHTYHHIGKGDTAGGIAQQYGISQADLLAANPQIKNPDRIYAGGKLNIPGDGSAVRLDRVVSE